MEDINTQKNENEEQVVKTQKEKTIFILKIVGNVVFYLFIFALLLFSIMNINASGKSGFPNIFGRGFLSVVTDSMDRSDKREDLEEWSDYKIGEIVVGDLVYVKKFKAKNIDDLNVGDVITFYDQELNYGQGGLNTHRIVYISEDKDSVITQGDARAEQAPFDKSNPISDANGMLELSGAIETVSVESIKGVVTGVNHGGAKTIDHIQKYWVVYFVVPVLLFLLFEVYMVVRNVMELKGAKQKAELETDKEAMLADIEAQKEEMRRQILAELQAQKEQLLNETLVEEPAVPEAVVEETPIIDEAPIVEEVTVAEEPTVQKVNAEEAATVVSAVPEESKKTTTKKTTSTAAKKTTSTTAKKTTSTTAKKTTSTAAKKTTSTAAKKTTSTAAKKTTAKKTEATADNAVEVNSEVNESQE